MEAGKAGEEEEKSFIHLIPGPQNEGILCSDDNDDDEITISGDDEGMSDVE